MARIAGSSGERTAEAIRRAALTLIYDHGFEGFGLRQLAAEVGLQPASLYNHIESKQALLFTLINEHIEDLVCRMQQTLSSAGGDAVARLRAFTSLHLEYHIEKKREVYVSNFELRALSDANRGVILSKRRRYEALLIGILDEAKSAGLSDVADTHVAAYALLAMLTGACTWYKPRGRLNKVEMIALHVKLVQEGWTREGALAAPDRLFRK